MLGWTPGFKEAGPPGRRSGGGTSTGSRASGGVCVCGREREREKGGEREGERELVTDAETSPRRLGQNLSLFD